MEPGTSRERAKAARRAELLSAAARLMADRGFAGVRLEDIGAAAGVSGPAMYRHFAGKQDVLAALLVEISERLYAGGRAVVDEESDPARALRALIEFHVDFAVTEPDLIRVQYRDLWSLPESDAHAVRRLQRRYVETWAEQATLLGGELGDNRARIHAVFGLLNSAPSLPALPRDRIRALLTRMALDCLGLPRGIDG